MINTRASIFYSLQKKIHQLTKHAKLDPDGFKTILYAVMLNDMKEWSEYISTEDNKYIVNVLENYIMDHGDFIIKRSDSNLDLYRNVNTPQDNTTWSRIWDNENAVIANPVRIN